jgi:hypothetical protein
MVCVRGGCAGVLGVPGLGPCPDGCWAGRAVARSWGAERSRSDAAGALEAVEHLVERLLFRVAVNQQQPTPVSLIALV